MEGEVILETLRLKKEGKQKGPWWHQRQLHTGSAEALRLKPSCCVSGSGGCLGGAVCSESHTGAEVPLFLNLSTRQHPLARLSPLCLGQAASLALHSISSPMHCSIGATWCAGHGQPALSPLRVTPHHIKNSQDLSTLTRSPSIPPTDSRAGLLRNS